MPSIIHIDMDAFYASVEQMDNPEYRGKPLIVGGGVRGVVCAASYEARRYGVRSAMAMFQARRLCPQAIVVPVRMKRYAQLSRQIHSVFALYTPIIEPISLDEAFLDVTAGEHLFGGPVEIGKRIKEQIKESVGLVASVGISYNKFLAKLASDLNKPDGFLVITETNKQQILDPLPISRLWGVGKITAAKLESFGIDTIAKLRNTPISQLNNLLGNQAQTLYNLSLGQDNRPVEYQQQAKSISCEDTFETDISDRQTLLDILHGQVELVSQKLRHKKLFAATVTLKFRYGDFKTVTRSLTMDGRTDKTVDFLETADKLFNTWYQSAGGAIRLLGFGVSSLSQKRGTTGLFDRGQDQRQRILDSTMDSIRKKYGNDIMKRGRIK
jgi:DNA polymerase IV